MSTAKVNDINMYYEVHGKGEPLVLIAGFSADHFAWREVLEDLIEQFQVIIFDNRGVGQSDVPEGDYSIEQMADDVIGLCQHLNINKAHFLGNSMGGMITQMIGYRHPDYIKSLIISNSAMNRNCGFKYFMDAQFELIGKGAPFPQLIKATSSWVYSYPYLSKNNNLEKVISYTINNPYPFTVAGYAGQRTALNQFDSCDWLSQIEAPTLVIGGDLDVIFIPPMIEAIANNIPNSEYIEFQQCGHLPMMECPQQFIETVSQFVNQHQ